MNLPNDSFEDGTQKKQYKVNSGLIRRGPWSPEEDRKLMEIITLYGPLNWVRILISLGSRSPKQCRERYHQNLKPLLNRKPITFEEGVLIEQLVAKYGKKWAEIARHLTGRLDNAIKNWWNGGANRRRRPVPSAQMPRLAPPAPSPQKPQGAIPPRSNSGPHVAHYTEPLPAPQDHHSLPPLFLKPQYAKAPKYPALPQIDFNTSMFSDPAPYYDEQAPIPHPGIVPRYDDRRHSYAHVPPHYHFHGPVHYNYGHPDADQASSLMSRNSSISMHDGHRLFMSGLAGSSAHNLRSTSIVEAKPYVSSVKRDSAPEKSNEAKTQSLQVIPPFENLVRSIGSHLDDDSGKERICVSSLIN